MFFPELIKSIKPTDKVLEIGPGAYPYPRSDILLEYEFESPNMAEAQRGYEPALKTDKTVIFYKGDIFPFKDKEFDYVICSHVIEHVSNVDQFISEINRVGKSGYLEYPTIYYDYVYNIPEHITFIKCKNYKIYWMNKNKTSLAKFQGVQNFFRESLEKKYWNFVQDLKAYFIEGFEWFDRIEAIKTSDLNDLLFDVIDLPENKMLSSREKKKSFLLRALRKSKSLLKSAKPPF
jgi:ubiquinone/menaquinone biosynthesis C-methylase UbiE